jgi:hypothetical protein
MRPSEPLRFRLDPAAFPIEARRMLRRTLTLFAATALVLVGAWAGILRERGAGSGSLLLPLALLALLAGLSHRTRVRRAHARWSGFAVALEGDAIVRELPGLAPLRLRRDEITLVEEGPGGVAVRARERAVLVPRQLEGYERFRAALEAWRGG